MYESELPDGPHTGQGWGQAPRPAPGASWVDDTVRAIGGVVGVLAFGFWLLCTYLVLSSVFSAHSASDPHGYSLIFGTVLGVPAGLVGAAVLPLVFARGRRARAYLVVVPLFVVVQALIFLAMYSS